jgi:hypothetical protein
VSAGRDKGKSVFAVHNEGKFVSAGRGKGKSMFACVDGSKFGAVVFVGSPLVDLSLMHHFLAINFILWWIQK